MSAEHLTPAPVGGKLWTKPFMALVFVGAVGVAMMVWRFVAGLGATTAMSDGYPWGLWIAFDVVTGTAIATGGYALALIIYIFNKGQYHPLIRPAVLTTALGYSIAGFSIVLDVGRYWLIWKIPLYFWEWNGNSVLLEVALCVMAYMMVAWIETGHAVLEKWQKLQKWPRLSLFSARLLPIFRKVLPFVIALGILLPTMHQSSLGSLFLSSTKVHPLWHTGWLPFLFLVSCFCMGFGGLILESTLSAYAFKRRPEWGMITPLAKLFGFVILFWVAFRLFDVFYRGAFADVTPGLLTMFVLELVLAVTAAVLLLLPSLRRNPGALFAAGAMVVFFGALYRFDTYLVAYNPGTNWHYFPSVQETLITVGLVSIELAIYVYVVKRFPILSGRSVTEVGAKPEASLSGKPARPVPAA